MAFKLTKAERTEQDAITAKLHELQSQLDEAVTYANNEIEAAVIRLNALVAEYNDAVEVASEFVNNHAATWREDCENKSEKWQEGDRGVAARAFVEEWESVGERIEQLSEFEVPELSLPGDSFADDIDQLPSETEIP